MLYSGRKIGVAGPRCRWFFQFYAGIFSVMVDIFCLLTHEMKIQIPASYRVAQG